MTQKNGLGWQKCLWNKKLSRLFFSYTNVLKYEPTNTSYLREGSNIYEQMEDHKMAIDGYKHILNLCLHLMENILCSWLQI